MVIQRKSEEAQSNRNTEMVLMNIFKNWLEQKCIAKKCIKNVNKMFKGTGGLASSSQGTVFTKWKKNEDNDQNDFICFEGNQVNELYSRFEGKPIVIQQIRQSWLRSVW